MESPGGGHLGKMTDGYVWALRVGFLASSKCTVRVEKDKMHCKGRNFRKFLLFGPKNCQKGPEIEPKMHCKGMIFIIFSLHCKGRF